MEHVEVNFYEQVEDELLKFAVIISKTDGKWVFCKHGARDTYEVTGGHREMGETEEILITDDLMDNWTYPLIQPKLIEEARKRGYCK